MLPLVDAGMVLNVAACEKTCPHLDKKIKNKKTANFLNGLFNKSNLINKVIKLLLMNLRRTKNH